ncbi:hypothetical protein MMC30_005041 [Trapelia coarctata]|nr:hypothetical protein [Trapelia coarctata]
MADQAKIKEACFLHIEALKRSIRQSWKRLKMDPTSFSKMSLKDRSPVASDVQKNASLSGPVFQSHVKQSESEQDSKERTRKHERRKKQEQNSASHPKSPLSVYENEEDGGVSLKAASNIVPAKNVTPKYTRPNPTEVNTPTTSANVSATTTNVPGTPEDLSAKTAHQAAKATIKLMKRERYKARRDAKSANMSQPSSSTPLDPTAAVYKPTNMASPLGDLSSSSGRRPQGFTPYEPVRFTSTATYENFAFPGPTSLSTPVSGPASAPVSAPIATPVSAATSSNQSRAVSLGTEPPKPPRQKRGSHAQQRAAQQSLRSGRAPEPEAAYILQASRNSTKMPSTQSLLLVLDLNGTLVYRKTPSINFTPRPFLSHFLEYCMTDHSVFVWSSARPQNVNRICSTIFTASQRRDVIAEWGRDTLELSSKDYDDHVQVYKRLDRIWNNETVQMRHPQYAQGGRWSQSNTVLIDDSMYKAAKQPYSHLEIPEYLGPAKAKKTGQDGDDVLGQVVAYLEEARKWDDVSRFIKQRKFRMNAEQSWDWKKRQMMVLETKNDDLVARGGVLAAPSGTPGEQRGASMTQEPMPEGSSAGKNFDES